MNSTPENQIDSQTHWLTAPRVAGLITIFLFALYPGIFFGTESFFFRDFALFTYPFAYYEHESFWHGQIPLWNPLSNCGIPFLAQWNTTVCYPPSLIYMLLPLPWSLNIFMLAHLVFAGVGMFLLARRWTKNPTAAGVAAFSFALSGLLLNHVMSTSNLASLSWQPFVILCAETAWQSGGARKIILAAFVGAMQMLAGSPEIILFTWTLIGILWLAQLRQKNFPFAFSLRRLLTIVILIAAISAIQLLPFFDLLKHSERSAGYEPVDQSPMPIWGWANFVVPFFRGYHTVFGTYLQPAQAWTCSYYVGIGTLVLAAVAIWRLRRQPLILILTTATFFGLVLALGDNGYVYAWLKHVLPWISFARYPIKFVCIAVFAIPMLAACGLNLLQNASAENFKLNQRSIIFGIIFSFLILVGILVAARWAPDAIEFDWHATWRDGALRAFFLIAISVAAIAFNRISSYRKLIGFAIPMLVALDVVTADLYINPTVAAKAFGPMELNMASHPQFGSSRAMISEQVALYLYFGSTTNAIYYLTGLRGALFENCNIPENIPKVDGFWPILLKDESRVNDIFYNLQTNEPPASLLNFLGISEITASNSMFAWQERKTFLPLITAGQKPAFESASKTFKQIASNNFDPRAMVYLPMEARGKISATNSSAAKISGAKFSAQQIEFNAEASSPTMAVIAQSFYHNWHAYIDGKPAQLWKANYAFQALEIPAGNHQIVLRYEDRMFRIGAIISILTLTVCVILFFIRGNSSSNGSKIGIHAAEKF